MSTRTRVSFGAVLTAAFAAVVFWPRNSESADARAAGEIPMGDATPEEDATSGDYENVDAYGMPNGGIDMDTFSSATNDEKLAAFLYMVMSCEHRFPTDITNGAAYSLYYGSVPFHDMSDHPVITGEMKPVQLPAQMCINAGYASGVCYSTAAGAFQIIKPTWQRVRQAGSWGPYLADFSPENQQEAARRLLIEAGALSALYNNDVEGAIHKASKLWASLPGAVTKQGPKTITFALSRLSEGLA